MAEELPSLLHFPSPGRGVEGKGGVRQAVLPRRVWERPTRLGSWAVSGSGSFCSLPALGSTESRLAPPTLPPPQLSLICPAVTGTVVGHCPLYPPWTGSRATLQKCPVWSLVPVTGVLHLWGSCQSHSTHMLVAQAWTLEKGCPGIMCVCVCIDVHTRACWYLGASSSNTLASLRPSMAGRS